VPGGDIEATLVVGTEAVGYAFDAGDEHALARGIALAIEVENANRPFVAAGHVEQPAVGREREAVGPFIPAGENRDAAP